MAKYNRYVKELVHRKIQTHFPFIVDTGVEAVPQSLLQASSIVIYSQRNPEALSVLQFASIGVSVASIMSKAYIACNSIIRQLFVFKFLCICFDISGLFYTITALWRARRGDAGTIDIFFLTRPVDVASAIWIYLNALIMVMVVSMFFVMATGLFGVSCHFVLHEGFDPESDRPHGGEIPIIRDVYQGLCGCAKDKMWCIQTLAKSFVVVLVLVMTYLGLAFVILLVLLPTMLILSMARLSYFVPCCKDMENKMQEAGEDFYIEAFEFFADARDASDQSARMQAINHVISGDEQPPVNVSVCSALWTLLFQKGYALALSYVAELGTGEAKSNVEAIMMKVLVCGGTLLFYLVALSTSYMAAYPTLSFCLEMREWYIHGADLNIFRLSLFCLNAFLDRSLGLLRVAD